MIKIIKELPKNKASNIKNIRLKSKVISVYIYSHALRKILNDCIKGENFRDILKYGDSTPTFKKGDTTEKGNFIFIVVPFLISRGSQRRCSVKKTVPRTLVFLKHLCQILFCLIKLQA